MDDLSEIPWATSLFAEYAPGLTLWLKDHMSEKLEDASGEMAGKLGELDYSWYR